jgi:hypothetical protein
MTLALPIGVNRFAARQRFAAVRTRRLAFAGMLVVLSVSGCGKKPPEFGQVAGTVRVNGQPQRRLVIRFMPDPDKGNNLPINSTGTTDAEGKYSLQHVYDGKSAPGAPVGWHRVVIEDTSHGPTPQGQSPPPPLFSYDYSNVGSTPLRKEVTSGTQTIDLDIGK